VTLVQIHAKPPHRIVRTDRGPNVSQLMSAGGGRGRGGFHQGSHRIFSSIIRAYSCGNESRSTGKIPNLCPPSPLMGTRSLQVYEDYFATSAAPLRGRDRVRQMPVTILNPTARAHLL